MKTTALSLLVMLSVVGLAGCEKEGTLVPTQQATDSVSLVRLFVTPEGCVVYRFHDGVAVHFVVCPSGNTSTMDLILQGKHIVPTDVPVVRTDLQHELH